MNQNEDKNLTDHNYDGIREYDNRLPNWWLFIFFGTIIFGFHYWIHYTLGGGQTQVQELAVDISALPKITERMWNETELQGKTSTQESLKMGQAVYNSKCSVCHGPEGQGLIGPNLTDNFWIHGKGERKGIIQIIARGVLEKGMPAWEGILSEDEEIAVTGFVYSLKNTKPDNPKASQGEEYNN